MCLVELIGVLATAKGATPPKRLSIRGERHLHRESASRLMHEFFTVCSTLVVVPSCAATRECPRHGRLTVPSRKSRFGGRVSLSPRCETPLHKAVHGSPSEGWPGCGGIAQQACGSGHR